MENFDTISHIQLIQLGYLKTPKRTGTDRNGQENDQNGLEIDRNGLEIDRNRL